MVTHNLMGGVAARVCDEIVTCIYAESVEAGDGSANVTDVSIEIKASVTPLQAKDIQRLAMLGQVVQDGVTVLLPFGTRQPDRIERADGTAYRIVNFSDVAGATVCTCDKLTLEASTDV